MNTNLLQVQNKREVWVDWLRVAACFMVIVVHCTEPFYLGGEGALITSSSNAFWAAFCDSFVRACVPLFIVASSYLQFPLHYSSGEFFKRRAVRILIPFAIWSLVYAFAWGEPVSNLKDLLLNFNYAAGHLWFVYMLIGLYLLMPLLSPWAEKVSKKELQVYIAIWLFTTLIPIIRDWVSSDPLAVTYGPTGIPRQALYPLWGEASWNTYGLFYYMSGFIGYLLLGLYFRRFVGDISWKKTLAIGLPCWLSGFAIVFGGFLKRVYETSDGFFPAGGKVDVAVYWETTWCNDTIGVVLMTIGTILIFRKITCEGKFYKKVLLPISQASYGMYLSHLLVLVPVFAWVSGYISSTPLVILVSAVATFAIVAVGSIIIRKIPKLGRYIIG